MNEHIDLTIDNDFSEERRVDTFSTRLNGIRIRISFPWSSPNNRRFVPVTRTFTNDNYGNLVPVGNKEDIAKFKQSMAFEKEYEEECYCDRCGARYYRWNNTGCLCSRCYEELEYDSKNRFVWDIYILNHRLRKGVKKVLDLS